MGEESVSLSTAEKKTYIKKKNRKNYCIIGKEELSLHRIWEETQGQTDK